MTATTRRRRPTRRRAMRGWRWYFMRLKAFASAVPTRGRRPPATAALRARGAARYCLPVRAPAAKWAP